MKITFSKRHPVIISIAYALLTIVFAVAAGVVISVTEADKNQQILIQAAFFWVSGLIGLLFMKISGYTYKEYGFRFSSGEVRRAVLWYAPMVLVEIAAFFAGPIPWGGIGAWFIFITFLFTLAVGINEEVYFRGLILKILSIKGEKFAIILSSVIFGLAHVPNILAGRTVPYIVLQAVFAFTFGLVCAALVVKTQSILAPIIWHFSHDFIAVATGTDVITTQALVVLAIQAAVLVAYAILLLRQPSRSNAPVRPTV